MLLLRETSWKCQGEGIKCAETKYGEEGLEVNPIYLIHFAPLPLSPMGS